MYIGDHAMSLVGFVEFELYVVCFMCTLVHLLLGTSNIFSICLSKKKKEKKRSAVKLVHFLIHILLSHFICFLVHAINMIKAKII